MAIDNTDSADNFYREANQWYEKGDFGKAIELFTKAIEFSPVDNPNLYRYHYNRGLAYACKEEYTTALDDLQKVLELNPDFPEAAYIRGICYESMERPDAAICEYKRALEKNPNFTDAENRLKGCYYKKSKPTEFLSSKPNGKDHSETLNKARELEQQGTCGEAVILLEKALNEDHDNFSLLLHRRILLDRMRQNKCEALFGLEEFEDMFDMLVICPLLYSNHPLYQAPIAQSCKGLLLYGPPGCGKNLLIRTKAKEARIKLVEIVLSEILNMYVGESEKRLTQIFREAIESAKNGQPVMIFIDEVDALGFARGMTAGTDEASWNRHLISTFLRLFNEIEDIPNLVVVAATNSFWSVDDALKRPGRLGDSIMYIPPPNENTRESMFRHFSKDTPGYNDVDFERLAAVTPFLSGADIKSICKDMHLRVAREIVKYGHTNATTKAEDYELCIDKKNPQILSWTRKVEKAIAEGRIGSYELDPRLIDDIKRARMMYWELMRREKKK